MMAKKVETRVEIQKMTRVPRTAEVITTTTMMIPLNRIIPSTIVQTHPSHAHPRHPRI
jgi:hypothetical protein